MNALKDAAITGQLPTTPWSSQKLSQTRRSIDARVRHRRNRGGRGRVTPRECGRDVFDRVAVVRTQLGQVVPPSGPGGGRALADPDCSDQVTGIVDRDVLGAQVVTEQRQRQTPGLRLPLVGGHVLVGLDRPPVGPVPTAVVPHHPDPPLLVEGLKSLNRRGAFCLMKTEAPPTSADRGANWAATSAHLTCFDAKFCRLVTRSVAGRPRSRVLIDRLLTRRAGRCRTAGGSACSRPRATWAGQHREPAQRSCIDSPRRAPRRADATPGQPAAPRSSRVDGSPQQDACVVRAHLTGDLRCNPDEGCRADR